MNKIQAGESLSPLRVYFFFAPQARSGWCEERGCHSTETPSTREIFTSSSTSSSLRTTGSAPRNLWYVGHVVYVALQPVVPPHRESDSFPPPRRSWRTCCPHDQNHPSSPRTRKRSTCRISTRARAHQVNAGRPTTTAPTTRAATTGRGCSVPTSSVTTCQHH